MKAIAIGAIVGLGVLCATAEARAEETAKRKPVVIRLDPIVGKPARPQAALDVAAVALKKPLAELRTSFVEKSEKVLEGPPF